MMATLLKQCLTCTNLLLRLVGAISAWIFIAPLAAIFPKRHDWVAVIGRQDGHFLDNTKYFYLQALQNTRNIRFVFITERPDVQESLTSKGFEVLRHPSREAYGFLLRCSCAVVDEASWHGKFRAFLLIRAHVIQLWHGAGFKWIESELWAHESGESKWASHRFAFLTRILIYRITRRRIRYAAVATTSRFYRDRVFSRAFVSRIFPITGYPRNDFALSLHGKYKSMAWMNVDEDIKASLDPWVKQGRKLVLVTPTFRDSGSIPMWLDENTLEHIDAFAEKYGVEFLFKFHPSEKNADFITGKYFHVCDRYSDVYPLFPYMNALVSDYSSISMDFLLTDKPVLHLIPENDDYLEKDRQLQFDPRTLMPSPIVGDWPTLLDALLSEWKKDGQAHQRAALRSQAFDDLPQADAVPKILHLMLNERWVYSAATASPEKSIN